MLETIQELGTRFLDAHTILIKVALAKPKDEMSFKDTCERVISQKRNEYQQSFSKFIKMLDKVDLTKRKKLLSDLVKGRLMLYDLANALGT